MSTNKEDLNVLLDGLENRFLNALLGSKLIGTEPWTSLLEEIRGVKEVFKDITEEDTFNYKEINIIDKLKLGEEIIKLKDADHSNVEIIDILLTQTGRTISIKELESWLEGYSNINLAAKPQVLRGSIFDTSSRMQDLYESLMIHLEEIKATTSEDFKYTKTTKYEVLNSTLSEMRQLTKDAAGVIAAVSNMNRYREFQQLIVEVIGTVSLSAQQQIIRKIQEQKSLNSTIFPD